MFRRAVYGAMIASATLTVADSSSAKDLDWLSGPTHIGLVSRHESGCKPVLTVSGTTTAPAKFAGGIAIDYWKKEASREYGASFANFKSARETIVKCRQHGNEPTHQCVVSGYPCQSDQAGN